MKAKNFFSAADVVLAMAFTFSCSDSGSGGDDTTSICSADFRTVKIGTQTWTAENLNCNLKCSVCYNNDPENCKKYGRLYDWNAAMKACPSGWHLPSSAEWDILRDYAYGDGTGSALETKLKATSGWSISGNGTDEFGFSALPGGLGFSDGSFKNVGCCSYWWSATESNSDRAYFIQIVNNDLARTIAYKSDRLYSVRCLQDGSGDNPSSSSVGGSSSSSDGLPSSSSGGDQSERACYFESVIGQINLCVEFPYDIAQETCQQVSNSSLDGTQGEALASCPPNGLICTKDGIPVHIYEPAGFTCDMIDDFL